MNLKKLVPTLLLALTFAGTCAATVLASSSVKESRVAYAEDVPNITFTHSDMGFKTVKEGTAPFKGYERQIQEGEYLNFDEVVGDSGYNKFERVDANNRSNTSNEYCTAHIHSGYLKFNVVIQGASHVKVRFTFRMAQYGGGTASDYYAIQVGSKSATKYYPSGTLPVGANTSYLYWRWENCEVENDFWLGSGTTTVYLTPGNGGAFCNLDCIYVDLVGDDQPVLNSLGTFTLEGEYLDVTNWTERTDMINAGRNTFLEQPGAGLTPATSNGLSIARYFGGNAFTLRFSTEAATNFTLNLVLAQHEILDFNDSFNITLDGNSMPMPEPGMVGGHTDQNQWYYWQTANLGLYSVESGNHTFVIESLKQPNIDCFTFIVTKYDGVGVDQIVNVQPNAAMTGSTYGVSNLVITDANPTPSRSFHNINGASFTTSRILITLTDEVSYFEGNVIGVNACSTSGKAVMKVYCGETTLGTQTLALSPFEYTYHLTSGNSGYIQIEITGDGQEELFIKWINIYGYTTGNTFSDNGVTTFCESLYTNLTCNGESRTYVQSAWTSLSETFDGLADEIQRVIAASPANENGSNGAKGLARYDYIIAKYAGKDYTSDFIGRSNTAHVEYGAAFASIPLFGLEVNNSAALFIVFAIIAIGVSAVVFITRKQKHN